VRATDDLVEPHEHARMPGDVAPADEHPERVGNPDGVPHDIVGRVAVGIVIFAGVGVLAYLAFGIIPATLIAIVTLWLVMRGIPKKARRERREEAAIEAMTPHPPANVADERRGDINS
jgi:hypothetical protein